ncbi:MAG: DUF262 domain-containing HNH endonuclease family protein, partial [Phycisphaerae bacterium]|nr:DUF262 domain-containing HNH endonuclease family protein [Phycisphaerae bacterium]
RAQMIFNEYLATKDLDTLELLPKLNLNDSDQDYFLKRIISNPNSPERKTAPSKKSHERINIAAIEAEKYVTYLSGVTGDPTKSLVQWINYLKEKAKVIAVRVPDESNAFTIFETLNDRGLALAVSDLLKNYLFYKSEDRVSEVQYKWVQVISTIEAAEDEQTVISFIRNYWSSKKGLVREKELFEKIKLHITTKSEAVNLSSGLFEASKIYSAMLTCDDNYWSSYPQSAKMSMQTLNFFKMVQVRPLVLALLENFEQAEATKALRVLVNVSVRFLIVGGLGGGALEQKYCDGAQKINNKEIVSSSQLSDFLKASAPSDAEFKAAFETATVSKSYLARYYLRALEMVERGDLEPEFVPNTSSDIVTLEHILPQNPSTAWEHVSDDDAKANYKRLGNMALLKKTLNSDIGNAGFEAKRPFYSASEYHLTSSLASEENWSVGGINLRQTYLAKLAIKAWPV